MKSFEIKVRHTASPFWLSCYVSFATRQECYEYVADLLERDDEVQEWYLIERDGPNVEPTHRWSRASKKAIPLLVMVAANEDEEQEDDVPF